MNDVLYRLYSITANDVADFHANTHIPVVVGSQMRYKITDDPLYKVLRFPRLKLTIVGEHHLTLSSAVMEQDNRSTEFSYCVIIEGIYALSEKL
ncbi:hypothetical protein VNO78_08165 [Psophocarpus tetragonolobus]|uniref:Uncharacterized protein n=1 Tax=Psophocarpus tetragonolobus TaxID=3891 RepID=A0AAN9XSQ5_PSOTE